MLNELSRYDNLGTPKIFHELFGKLANSEHAWTTLNVNEYFHNRIIDGKSIFDGCLPLAQAVGAVRMADHGIVSLNPILTAALSSEEHLSFRFLEIILEAVKDDEVFHQIFCSENISYDVIYEQIQIENGAFRFRYANFRHLLVNFAFLQPHPDSNIRKLIICPKYKKLFDSRVMPEIKKRKIGIEQLKKLLTQKEISGREGEAFVLRYEQKRLAAHPQSQSVKIISDYYTNAGYDIVSYDNLSSKEHDRFIEVKAYRDNLKFHWSRNEMDVARIKKHQYFLYLVDRNQINNENYNPLIIQNPHEQVLEKPGQWEKLVEEYSITQSTT